MLDKEAKKLIKLYEKAEKDLTKQITTALLKGNQTEYLRSLKKNTQEILQQLRKDSKVWCNTSIPRVYASGEAAFGDIHQQAMKILAENSYSRLEDVTAFVGRRVDDVYRTLALESVRATVAGYDSWQKVARNYRQNLANKGITGFQDRLGRKWNMSSYTRMVARTTTMEAQIEGTKNRIIEQGHDLVKVSSHVGECPLCTPWGGRVLSLTGKTPGYTTLDEARQEGLFHPNCRHALGLFIDLDTEIAGLEKDLEKPTREEIIEKFTLRARDYNDALEFAYSLSEEEMLQFKSLDTKLWDFWEKATDGGKLLTTPEWKVYGGSIKDIEKLKLEIPKEVQLIRTKEINNEATTRGTKVLLGDKFEALSDMPDVQEHIIIHELGHVLTETNKELRLLVLENPEGVFGRYNIHKGYFDGVFGQYNPEEAWAESFAVYHTNPALLKDRYPKVYDFMKLLDNKLGDYNKVIKKTINKFRR